MTQEEIDTLWQQAMRESVKDGETFIRYHFAKLVAVAERDACAKVCEEYADDARSGFTCAKVIRNRGQA